jgi:hypothetical protein
MWKWGMRRKWWWNHFSDFRVIITKRSWHNKMWLVTESLSDWDQTRLQHRDNCWSDHAHTWRHRVGNFFLMFIANLPDNPVSCRPTWNFPGLRTVPETGTPECLPDRIPVHQKHSVAFTHCPCSSRSVHSTVMMVFSGRWFAYVYGILPPFLNTLSTSISEIYSISGGT